jgi:hypothetical protein
MKRPPPRSLAVLLALPAAPACAASAAPASPPPTLIQALADRECRAPRWSPLTSMKSGPWSDGWVGECSARGGDKLHALYAFRRRSGDSRWSMEKVAEYQDSDEPRNHLTHESKVNGNRVTVKATGDFGYSHVRTWDTTSLPARLVEESEGGLRPCQREMALHPGAKYANPDIAEPLCTTNWETLRQTCVRDHPDCKRDATRFHKISYTAIPLHSVLGKGRTADPFACATTVGLDKEDLVAGRNPNKTSFKVVGIHDPQAETLRILVRLDDKTAELANSVADDWRAKDHWELWLGSDRDDVNCGAQMALVQFCTELRLRWKLAQQIIVPLANKSFLVFPSNLPPGPPRSPALQVHWEGKTLSIDLSGAAYQAAHHGALTLVYSDSLDGKKADTLIGTSPLQSGVAEAPGRVGDYALCDVPEKKPDETGDVITLQ